MKTTRKLAEVKISDTFKVADIEWIKFAEKDGNVIAVAKDILFRSEFGSNNNYADKKCFVRKKLETEVLPKIENEIGAENLIEFETDLISLDGDKQYGKYKSKIGLPTFDFYRENVEIFDKYNVDKWWWLSTPFSTNKHLDDYWTSCVSPLGNVFNCIYNFCYGVRPFLIFVSSISVTCEE